MEHVYEDELDSVPEPDHVAQVMDGFIDTVSGSESFTKAQHYLEAVLFSNGIIRHRDVGGTEGILGKVADGAKAAIEYIKKIFRSIWDFFFKREKKSMEDKVDKAIEEAKKDLDAIDKSKVTPENVDSAIKKAATEVDKLKDGPEKTKLKEKVKEAQESKDTSFKIKIATVIPGEVFQAWRIPGIITATYEEQFAGALKKVEELLKKQKDGGDPHQIAGDMQKIVTAAQAMPKNGEKVNDIAGAEAYLNAAKKCSDDMCAGLENISRKEAEFKRVIEDLEKSMDKDKAKASTVGMKESLTGITGVIHEVKVMCRFLESAAKNISKGCILII